MLDTQQQSSQYRTTMPGLRKESLLDTVLKSCEALSRTSSTVSISQEALQDLITNTPLQKFFAAARPVDFPVRFESTQGELNFFALLHLLDFGSAYDPVLHQQSQRTAPETVIYGVLGMYISGEKMDADFLEGRSIMSVGNYFDIKTHQDEPLQPGITVSRPGPLMPYAQALLTIMNNTGQALKELGFDSLGHLLQAGAAESNQSAAKLVEFLTKGLPGFNDASVVEGQQVVFQRKAVNLVEDLQRRFGDRGNEAFNFEDVHALPGDSGAQTIGALFRLEILNPSPEVAAKIKDKQELSGDEAAALRAAAVAALQQISIRTGAEPQRISAYLLAEGVGQCNPRIAGSIHV